MQNDIIKRPPVDPATRAPEKLIQAQGEAKKTEPSVASKATAPQAVDAVNTQNVPNERSGETASQPDQPKPPAGPGAAIGAAVFVCLILVGLVVYSQMSN